MFVEFSQFLLNIIFLIILPKNIFFIKLHFFLFNLIFIGWIYSYIISDLSVINILNNTHTSLPFLYKIGGVWGNHEGSLMLWNWVLNLYTFILLLYTHYYKNSQFLNISLKLQYLINNFFILFIIMSSNGLLKHLYFILDGKELNPILQDPTLIIHPPFLYLGYLGFTIPLVLALTSLYLSIKPVNWAYFVRFFVLISWGLLTFGILLGSWWAYYELGWGGWWFWDPVENVSLIPWLLGAALLHSLFKNNLWSFIMALSAFSSSVIGTFFVRTGMLPSVHSFATDYSRGYFILIFIVLLLITNFYLFFSKGIYLIQRNYYGVFSRYNLLNFNNLFLYICALLIFLGTFIPGFFILFFNKQISITEEFYNTTLIPFISFFLIIMILTPFIGWKKSININIIYLLTLPLTSILIIGYFMYDPYSDFIYYILLLSLFMMIILILYFKKNIPMFLGHLGFALLIFSIGYSTLYQESFSQVLFPGDFVNLGKFNVWFLSVDYDEGPNYLSFFGRFLFEYENLYSILTPEKNFYYVHGSITSKAAIFSNYFADIYALLGDGNFNDGWNTRFFYNPLISGLWLSGILMTLASFVSFFNLLKPNKNLNWR